MEIFCWKAVINAFLEKLITWKNRLFQLPVTLPKEKFAPISIPEPKLTRKPSLLDLAKIEEQKPADSTAELASHLSEFEMTRFGETLGVSSAFG